MSFADARTRGGLTCAELGLRFEPKTGPDRYFVHIYTPSGTRLYDWHDVLVRDPARGRPMRHSIARDVTEEMLAASQREEARRRAEGGEPGEVPSARHRQSRNPYPRFPASSA
ncbi:hypothetical protein Q1M63_19360 [Sinorhizobium meliloti]|nr:hypothetical protein Q1M63_19360 [Sinorhizobium meliloti]